MTSAVYGQQVARAPQVTIVTPVFNGASYIVETVESVLAQDYANLQYIVLDDGSTDDTLRRLHPYRDRLTLLSHPNMGEARTVNRGVELASGDIIGVVNADDPILPGLVTAAVEALQMDSHLVAVYPDWLKIDERGRVLDEVKVTEYSYDILLAQHLCIPGPGAFFRPARMRGEIVRDPTLRFSTDYDFWLRLGLYGAMARIPRTLATWRQHRGGTSQAHCGPEMARAKIDVIERFFARPDLPDWVRSRRAQALSAAYFSAALLGLRSAAIPVRSYLVRSFLAKPVWPPGILPQQRRSLLHVAYLLAQPLSGHAHEAISRFLPNQFRREAVIGQRFGKRLNA